MNSREAFEAWFAASGWSTENKAEKLGAWTGWNAATAHARDVAVRVCESVSHDNPMTANDCADAIKEALK